MFEGTLTKDVFQGDVTLIQIHILYTTCLLCVMMLFLLFYLGCGKRWTFKSKVTVHSPDKVNY